MDNPENVDQVTPWMYVYKENIQYVGSLDNLNSRILVRGDLHNK